MKVIAQYGITYDNGIYQEKNLIRHTDFTDVILPTLDRINELEILKQKEAAKRLRAFLVGEYGEYYFTDESPLHDAVTTGILVLPETQGGSSKCKVIIIDPPTS